MRRQFNTIPGLMEGTARPDYKACVAISTNASLSEMIPPGALVMLTPVIVGSLFGTQVRVAALRCGGHAGCWAGQGAVLGVCAWCAA